MLPGHVTNAKLTWRASAPDTKSSTLGTAATKSLAIGTSGPDDRQPSAAKAKARKRAGRPACEAAHSVGRYIHHKEDQNAHKAHEVREGEDKQAAALKQTCL